MWRTRSAALLVLLQGASVYAVESCSSRQTAGIVLGTIAGTLLVVGIVAAIAYLVWRRSKRQRVPIAKKRGHGDETYDNQTFEGDVERGTKNQKSFAEQGFSNYVECREYERHAAPVGYGQQHAKSHSPVRQVAGSRDSEVARRRPPTQRGSHGSLNSFPVSDAEMISVQLISRDVIGLGFNVCGSISNGIYVDEVLNRGPAIETGLIKTGDRIMSLSISFKNMVYEDALTILSYASAYPVRLLLQKAVTSGSSSALVDIELNANNRSQSMSDISKIHAADGAAGGAVQPSLTESDLSAQQAPPLVANMHKWGNSDLRPLAGPKVSVVSQMSESPSQFSLDRPDMNLDTAELLSMSTDATVHTQAGATDGTEGMTGGLEGIVQKTTAGRACSVDGGELSEQDKIDMIRLSYEDPDAPQISAYGGAGSEGSEENNNLTTFMETVKSTPRVELLAAAAAVDGTEAAATDLGLAASDGAGERRSAARELERQTAVRLENEGAKAVLQDYFGNQPSLLAEFGLPPTGGAAAPPRALMVERNSLEVEETKSTTSSSRRSEAGSSRSSEAGERARLGNGESSSRSSQTPRLSAVERRAAREAQAEAEDEVRRNIGYFVRLDEPHNPAPEVYNLSFQLDELSQPALIRSADAPDIAESTSAADEPRPVQARRLIRPLITDVASDSDSDAGSRTTAGFNGKDEVESVVGMSSVSLKSGSSGSVATERLSDITVVRDEDRPGAYTVHVQAQHDDSEA